MLPLFPKLVTNSVAMTMRSSNLGVNLVTMISGLHNNYFWNKVFRVVILLDRYVHIFKLKKPVYSNL